MNFYAYEDLCLCPMGGSLPESAAAALADVTRDYSQTVSAIRAYLESEG